VPQPPEAAGGDERWRAAVEAAGVPKAVAGADPTRGATVRGWIEALRRASQAHEDDGMPCVTLLGVGREADADVAFAQHMLAKPIVDECDARADGLSVRATAAACDAGPARPDAAAAAAAPTVPAAVEELLERMVGRGRRAGFPRSEARSRCTVA
jgi:hypothetical protein